MATNGRFEALALAIATGCTIKKAAQQLGIGQRTAYRIAATDRMKTRVCQLRTQITSEALGTLTTAASAAANTLASLLDASNDPSIRLNAAKAILTHLAPLSEFSELRQRIDALERVSEL
jgi:hypothetical protein